MNPPNAEGSENRAEGQTRGLSAAAVAAFLQGHPDFFIRHSHLLAGLQLPHDCGAAVSLVEYQVSVLRDHNLRLRRQLDGLVATARDNEALIERLHHLALGFLACEDVAQALDVLDDAIRSGFHGDFAAVRLFMSPPLEERGRPEFLGDGEEVAVVYGDVLRARAPACGPVAAPLAGSLFGDAASEVGSAVVAPLGERECFGVLAIGSRDASRFQPGMGTLFIRQLAAMAAATIQRHLP